jgi:hypothetical protein
MGTWESVRRYIWLAVMPARKSVRLLAFEIMMMSAEIVGQDAAPEPGSLPTPVILATAHDYLATVSRQVSRLDQNLAALQKENVSLRQQIAAHHEFADLPVAPPVIARDLIEIADRLGGEQDDPAARWLDGRIAHLLAQSEIYRVEDVGIVDPARHQVVETCGITDDERVNHIAATVRPGYGWRGQILRPQAVVAFVKASSR